MKLVLVESPKFRGQLQLLGDDPNWRYLLGVGTQVDFDGHIVNRDEAFELCRSLSKLAELTVTDGALEILKQCTDSHEPETPSWQDPWDGFSFKRYQRRCINVLEHESNVLLQLDTGMGKAQPLDEPVLTPDGWVPIGDIDVGDRVIDGEGGVSTVSGVFRQGEREIYEVELVDGSVVRCADEHLWLVQENGPQAPWRARTTGEMLEDGVRTGGNHQPKFKVPVLKPVRRPHADLPIDPYAYGVLLCDGSLTEPDVVDRAVSRLNGQFGGGERDCDWCIVDAMGESNGNRLSRAVAAAGFEFVDEKYLEASVEQRRMLLAGLFDAGGSVLEDGGLQWRTASPRMADGFERLCNELGYRTRRCMDRGHGDECLAIQVETNDEIFLSEKHRRRFALHGRKAAGKSVHRYETLAVSEIRRSGEFCDMVCIMLDGDVHTYVTTGYVVTHNTYVSTFMALQRYDRGDCDKIVVWCPVSLVYDWVRTLEGATRLSVGTPKRFWPADKRAEWYRSDGSDIWVLNYERVRTGDLQHIEKALRKRKALFVYDEVQKLSRRSSAVHREHRKLCNRVAKAGRIALTATPIVKGPENFYDEFRIVDPDVFGNVSDFERLFTYNNGEKDMWGGYVGYQNLPQMHLMAGAQVCSISKSRPEVAREFPEKQEVLVGYELSKDERGVYDDIMAYGRTIPSDERCGTLFMLMLQRLCNMPEVLLRDFPADDDTMYALQLRELKSILAGHRRRLEKAKGSKLQLVEEKVDQIVGSGEKLIIFANHTHNCLFPLAGHLERYDPLLYVGGMSPDDKDRTAQAFKTDPKRNLLLMSDAGQVGLNFQECRYLMHYQTPTAHAHYEQRSNRIHRLSSEWDSVTIYRFAGAGTIEERVEDTMQGRRRMAADMGFGGEYEELGAVSSADADWFCGF